MKQLRTSMPVLLLTSLLGCGQLGASGGQGSPEEAVDDAVVSRPELLLERGDDGLITVVLRAVEDRQPRMLEARVRWSDGWTFHEHMPGKAASDANKDVYVQKVHPTEARVMVFSSGNTETIGSGTLAKLRFSGGGAGTVEIVPTPPMLAPAEAEDGLLIGDPISF